MLRKWRASHFSLSYQIQLQTELQNTFMLENAANFYSPYF